MRDYFVYIVIFNLILLSVSAADYPDNYRYNTLISAEHNAIGPFGKITSQDTLEISNDIERIYLGNNNLALDGDHPAYVYASDLVVDPMMKSSKGLPDLIGFDGRPHGSPHDQYYYDVEESAIYWGEPAHIQLFVWNQAPDPAGAFNVNLYISDNNDINDGNDYLLYTLPFSSGIGGWGYNGYDITLYLPSTNPIGGSSPYYIGMVVDADEEVTESNEANNKNQGAGTDYDSLTILVPEPDVQVFDSVGDDSDLALDFGEVVDDGSENSKATETVSIVNNGKAPLLISQDGIGLADGSNFLIDKVVSSTQDLIDLSYGSVAIAANGKETWAVKLLFDPHHTGSLDDILAISSDDPDEGIINVSVQGFGLEKPDLHISLKDRTLGFGMVPNDGHGSQTLSKSFTLQNTGSGPLTVSKDGILLGEGLNFEITSIVSDVQGVIDLSSSSAIIQEKRSEIWTIDILCDPLEDGQIIDSITVLSDDPNENISTITLDAFGLAVQDIAYDKSSIDFGGVHADGVGNQIGIDTLTATNDGEAKLNISGISFNTGTVYRIKEIKSNAKGEVNGTNIIEGNQTENWTITLEFDPNTAGIKTDTLVLQSNDPDENPLNISITGSGLDEADISSDSQNLAFDPTLNDGPGNRITERTITLKNIGIQPLDVSQIDVMG